MSASSPEVASLLGDSGASGGLQQDNVCHGAEDGDLAPTPRHERTWSSLDFARMWVSILVNPSGYILGAALLHLGLGWREERGSNPHLELGRRDSITVPALREKKTRKKKGFSAKVS